MKRIYPLQGMRVWHSMLIIGLILAVGALSIAYAHKEHDHHLLLQKLAKGSNLKQQLMDYENELKAKSERIEELEEKLHNQEELTEEWKQKLHNEEEKLTGTVEELEEEKDEELRYCYLELKKCHEKQQDQQLPMGSGQYYPSSDSLEDMTSSASLSDRSKQIKHLASHLHNCGIIGIQRTGSSQSLASFKLHGSSPSLSLPGVFSREPGTPVNPAHYPHMSNIEETSDSSPKGRGKSSSTDNTQDQGSSTEKDEQFFAPTVTKSESLPYSLKHAHITRAHSRRPPRRHTIPQ